MILNDLENATLKIAAFYEIYIQKHLKPRTSTSKNHLGNHSHKSLHNGAIYIYPFLTIIGSISYFQE